MTATTRDRAERALVWLFAAWCAVRFVDAAGLVSNALEADRNPLLPDATIRALLWWFAGAAVAYAVGAGLAAARLSTRGDRWRLVAGIYAVLLVGLRWAGWV